MRCRACGKVVYASRQSATRAGRRVAEREGVPKKRVNQRYRAYRCPWASFGWHITRTKTMREHLEETTDE